jgi:hypothetical protein
MPDVLEGRRLRDARAAAGDGQGLARCVLVVAVAAVVWSATATALAASSDRAIKACLLTRRAPPPTLVVYGSSRAAKLEPAYLGAMLGEPVFNASVSSATPEDVWAFAHLAHDQAGSSPTRALWLLDLESLRPHVFDAGLLQTPSLGRYFTATGGSPQPAPETSHGPLRGDCSFTTSARTHYAPDGFRKRDIHDAAAAAGATLAGGLRRISFEYTRIYRSRYPSVSPDGVAWLERTIHAFNDWGVRPVIVLTPVHPALLRALGPAGWTRRHADIESLLQHLQARFTVLDASRISSFGGKPDAFYDGVHMRVANMRLLTAWIERHARHDLAGS